MPTVRTSTASPRRNSGAQMSGKQENLESVINLRILYSIYAECVSGDALRESYGQV